jgi:glycosyltransferase involved in cell wall biosynthesis
VTISVLHLRSSGGLYGPERHLLELAPALRECGVMSEVALLLRPRPACAPHPVLGEAEARGERVNPIADPGRWPGAAAEAVSQLLATRRFDLLHAHDFKANAVALRVASRHPCRTVATFHLHTHGSARLLLYELVDRWQLARFDAVIAVARALEGDPGLSRVARSRIAVVPNGIDSGRFEAVAARDRVAAESLLTAEGDGPLVLSVGRLARQKGIDLLVRAVARLREEVPGLRLAVAGDGPEGPRLERLACELGVERRVRWLGARPEIAGLLSAADLVAVPSRSEGLPYVVLEALALGRPVVAAAVGGIPELVRDGEEGWLVPPGDVEALAAALASALSAPEEMARRAAAGRERVRASFQAREMAQRTAAVYRRLAA